MILGYFRAMRAIICCLIGLGIFPLFGQIEEQVEVEIGCGDTAILGVSSRGEGMDFVHIDAYRKTRFTGVEKAYDTATGQGFFESFFRSGDFDAAELPASYAGKALVILGVEEVPLTTANSQTRWARVVYLHGDVRNTVFWVDFDEALASGEIQEFRANWDKREGVEP